MAFEDDYLASVMAEVKAAKKTTQLVPVQTFLSEKFGSVAPLPAEYNKAVDEYISTFSDIAVKGAIGARPKRNVHAYDEHAAEKKAEFLAAVNQYAPKHKLLYEMSPKESDHWIKNFIAKEQQTENCNGSGKTTTYSVSDLPLIFKHQREGDVKSLQDYYAANKFCGLFVVHRMNAIAEALVPNQIQKNSELWNTLYPVKLERVQNLFSDYVNTGTKNEIISVQSASNGAMNTSLNAPIDDSSSPQGILFALAWTVVVGAIGLAFRSWLNRTASSRKWQTIDHANALNEPLYGIKGWLIVFMISLVLGVAGALGKANQSLAQIDVSLTWWRYWFSSIQGSGFFTFEIVFMLLMTLTILTLAIKKDGRFRAFTTIVLVLFTPYMIGLHLIEASANKTPRLHIGDMLGIVGYWAVSCAVWISYLNLSKRVRLTFEHSVPASISTDKEQDDASLTSKNQSNYTDQDVPINPLNTVKLRQNTYDFWANALAEFDSPERHTGLWARLFSEAQGNENQAKAKYLQVRVAEMQQALP